MSDDLYHARMLRLAKGGDAGARLAAADASVTLDNPLCGDRVTIDVRCDADGRIVELGHAVRGCVLCRAAAAVLGGHAGGHAGAELEAVRARLRGRLRDAGPLPDDPQWQDLEVFAPVAAHKSRHECVLLPFDAVLRALAEAAGRSHT